MWIVVFAGRILRISVVYPLCYLCASSPRRGASLVCFPSSLLCSSSAKVCFQFLSTFQLSYTVKICLTIEIHMFVDQNQECWRSKTGLEATLENWVRLLPLTTALRTPYMQGDKDTPNRSPLGAWLWDNEINRRRESLHWFVQCHWFIHLRNSLLTQAECWSRFQ